ncbi:MAG: PTS transporter subunit EIIC [Solobacterium sp.]|jgi:PTS system beta-glucosides-specific IIC component|nr:PTS transporter subunit EIIC [Solobacterium sp.]
MAVNNEQIAKDVLAAVGGKGNIAFVTHCITRLRFTLKDKSVPNSEEIKKIPGVLGTNVAGDQYQVIIGQNVPKVYDFLCKEAGLEQAAAVDENLDAPKEKLTLKSIGGKILDYLAGSMTPLIPAMMAAAMFKTLEVVLGPDMLGFITSDSDFYKLCEFVYYGFFYFLPIYLGYTASKKVGLNPMLGAFAAGCLLVPDFVTLANTEGATFSVYGISARLMTYGQTVLPILLIVPVMSVVFKFFAKHIPDVLSTVFTPFLTMVVMVPLIYCILGPLGGYLGDLIGNGLVAFGDFGGFLAVAVVAALWEFLVITGMHQVLIVFGITTLMSVGSDHFVLVAGGMATWAAFGMAFGSFLRMRNKDEKALALGYTVSGLLGGVTEPVLYGIGFKYKKPFIAMMIGGFCGGIYAGLTGVGTYVMGATNFLAVIGYLGGGTSNMINGCIGAAIAFSVSAALTYFIGFNKNDPALQKD